MRRIALIAAALAALSGCGGEATTKQGKAPVSVTDWQTDAHVACLRVPNAFTERYASDLRQLRNRLPGVAREVRAAAKEIRALEQPPGDEDAARFVAALGPVETSVASLVNASRTMNTGRLTPATRRLEVSLVALAKAARRSGLECLKGGAASGMVSDIRAPIAAERLAAIERHVLARLRAANDVPAPAGPRAAIAALEEEDAALRTLAVPDWARPERAAFRRGCRGYREGLAEVIERYNTGQGTTHEQWLENVKRPAQKCDRLMQRLWTAMRADPVHRVK